MSKEKINNGTSVNKLEKKVIHTGGKKLASFESLSNEPKKMECIKDSENVIQNKSSRWKSRNPKKDKQISIPWQETSHREIGIHSQKQFPSLGNKDRSKNILQNKSKGIHTSNIWDTIANDSDSDVEN